MKGKDILIDSDIIIWLLRGEAKILTEFKNLYVQHILCTTPITVAEVLSGARKNEIGTINNLFHSLEVLPIDNEIGVAAGAFMNKYGKSHAVELADAMIAATAIENDLRLWTMNLKHYPMLGGNQLLHSKQLG